MKSLEFLFQNLLECPKDKFIWYSYFEKAKVMHKQEIIDAYETSHISMMTSEQYYQETFVSDHISDISKMVSDEEILTEANNRYVIEDEIEAFIQGANWMQEKLKSK